MRVAMIAFGVALAGCTLQGAARPVDVRLSQDTLTVSMSDGSRCVTAWAAGQGRMADCGGGLDWQVTVEGRPNPLRLIFAELTAALQMQKAVPPLASVVLTDGRGRKFVFASPPPPPDGNKAHHRG